MPNRSISTVLANLCFHVRSRSAVEISLAVFLLLLGPVLLCFRHSDWLWMSVAGIGILLFCDAALGLNRSRWQDWCLLKLEETDPVRIGLLGNSRSRLRLLPRGLGCTFTANIVRYIRAKTYNSAYYDARQSQLNLEPQNQPFAADFVNSPA